MQNKAALCYPNYARTATLSGGAWSSTLPLGKLQTEGAQDIARTTDALNASTVVDATLDQLRPMQLFALQNHNASLDALWRIRVWEDALGGTELAYDSGSVEAFPPVYTEDTAPGGWEGGGLWDLTLTEDDLGGGDLLTLFHLAPDIIYGRYIRIELFDAGNAAGYLQAGKLFVGPLWQPAYNISYGARIGWEDASVITASESGSERFSRRPKWRVAQIALDYLGEDEGMTGPFDMQRIVGVTDDVFFVWRQSDTIHAHRRSFLGRLRKLEGIEANYFDNLKTTHEIKEKI